MLRKAFILFVALVVVACSPRLIPLPVTPSPAAPPATDTPVPLNAPLVTSPGLTTIHMIDASNGWGISDTTVLRTLDGGQTWYDVGPKDAGQLGYAATSAFLDTQHAWVLAADPSDMLKGTLFRTVDGGVNWDRISVPFGGGSLDFLDPKSGWMMASLGAGAGSMGVAIYRTLDGGSTWTQSYTNDPNQPGAGNSLPLGGLKNELSALNMSTAWVGGVTYTPGVVYLYRSTDAGVTWQPVNVPAPDGYDQAELSALAPIVVNSNLAYLPVTVSSQNGVMLAIYVSKDGGNTWALTPTMIPQGGPPQFVGANDGFSWNGAVFYVTHDGAQTWTAITPDVHFGGDFAGMDFVSPTTGWVITSDASGAHGLFRTTDGGATWNVLGR